MKNLIYVFSTFLLVFILPKTGLGADFGNSLVTFNFLEINEISILGSPILEINTAIAGQEPDPAIDTSSTYAITTNGTVKKITASINTDMPANMTLEINLIAPSGSGTSLGFVILSTTPRDIVTGISHVVSSNRTISYRFTATADAGVLNDTRIITLTVSN